MTTVKRTRSNTPLAALITLNNQTFVEASQGLARRVLSALSNPIHVEGHEIRVTASIGVATVSRHSPFLEHVLTQADRALYQAKSEGRNTVCVVD